MKQEVFTIMNDVYIIIFGIKPLWIYFPGIGIILLTKMSNVPNKKLKI